MPDIKWLPSESEVREGCAGEVATALADAIDSVMSIYSVDDGFDVTDQLLAWCTPLRDELVKLSETLRKPVGVIHTETKEG